MLSSLAHTIFSTIEGTILTTVLYFLTFLPTKLGEIELMASNS